jgi:hypothetical protein
VLLLPFASPYTPPPVPVFNAVGAGFSAANSSVTSGSWSHTATAGAYAIALFLSSQTASSVTYGGSAMTSLGSITDAGATTYMYGLSNVAGGAQTVAVTISAAGQLIGNSLSYTGVTTVGTPVTVIGSSASASQAMTCTTNQILVHAFGGQFLFTSPSGGTTRYNGGTAGWEALLIQDATANATFAASLTSGNWAGIGALLS